MEPWRISKSQTMSEHQSRLRGLFFYGITQILMDIAQCSGISALWLMSVNTIKKLKQIDFLQCKPLLRGLKIILALELAFKLDSKRIINIANFAVSHMFKHVTPK